MNYKKQDSMGGTTIWYDKDGVRVSFMDPSPGNTDWEAYQRWVAAGNAPEVIEA